MSRTNNLLTARQSYGLTKWVEENKSYVLGHSLRAVARHAAKVLGCKLTESNVRTACRTLGMEPRRSGPVPSGRLSQVTKELDERVDQLSQRLNSVEAEVAWLRKELGLPLPSEDGDAQLRLLDDNNSNNRRSEGI